MQTTSPLSALPESYEFKTIEAHYQQMWTKTKAYEVDTAAQIQGERFYCLSMFPYPSGQLHMGHVRNYTISDTIARVAMLEGKTVLHPMGWDAFGLPAENAAIKNNVHPAQWTKTNMESMRAQLQRLGLGVDWSKELATCQPDYYKWEQWLFIQMYNKGLVYKKESIVNWDPIDQTVLANEQVIDGKGWRSGATVERRKIPQWFFKITDYADQLLDDLDDLPHWPEGVKTMQRNWIGRSEGAQVTFTVEDQEPMQVFTTRPDTIYGVTFLAIAPTHHLALIAAQNDSKLADLIERMARVKTAEADIATLPKEGRLTPFTAKHPLTGQQLPIWVANYVLADYGSGAVMCVPAHDQRDWEFANLYNIEIKPVVETKEPWDYTQGACTELGTLINSAQFNTLTSEEGKTAIAAAISKSGFGSTQTEYRLRDWGVSRQRYWGAPIPMIYCKNCGDQPVPENQLPVVLPDDISFSGEGSPLAQHSSFKNTSCPKCQGEAIRETDTFDTFMESSWYYARFTCPQEKNAILSPAAHIWTPVDQYVGGIEHATMHLLYSRFIHKVLRDFGLVTCSEPFTRLLCQGMVLSESFHRVTDKGEKIYVNSQNITFKKGEQGEIIKALETATGLELSLGTLEKMSKSKNNGVDPNSLIDQYGADTVRLFSMFTAPPEQTLEWSNAGVEGAFRFLKRFWKQSQQHSVEQASLSTSARKDLLDFTYTNDKLNSDQTQMRLQIHTAIAKVTDDYTRRQSFNTGIAALMKLSNQISSFTDVTELGIKVRHEGIRALTLLLSPIAPHICAQIWETLDGSDILKQAWPALDEAALLTNQFNLVVQVNGKKRHAFEVDASLSQDEIKALALTQTSVQKFIDEKTIVKVIYVPGKLVNVVVR